MTGENKTIEVREGEELDLAAVDKVLKSVINDLSGDAKLTQYPAGESNLTYALDYPNRRLVLRRPPFGDKPKSGHNMHREYRVMAGLNGHVPVPNTIYYTDDASIIGAEFYVMDRSEGPLIHKTIPPEWGWTATQNRQLCENFFEALVHLHKVDFQAVGLGDFGRPKGYATRQILGWNRRFEAAWTDDIEKFEDVQKWLVDNIPAKERRAALLHGDYRIDNCILNAQNPLKIEAILDWEISALGDPMMDLGNALAYWVDPKDPEFLQKFRRQPSTAPGMMTRQEILDFYTEKTGEKTSNFLFYYVYGIWRLAVITQQIYARFYRGQTKNQRAKEYGQITTFFAEYARHKIQTQTL